jgi:hypothetical protein
MLASAKYETFVSAMKRFASIKLAAPPDVNGANPSIDRRQDGAPVWEIG